VFWIFALCLWSDQSEFMAPLQFLICGLVHILFLSLVFSFEFFITNFPVTILGLDLRTALSELLQQVVVISY